MSLQVTQVLNQISDGEVSRIALTGISEISFQVVARKTGIGKGLQNVNRMLEMGLE